MKKTITATTATEALETIIRVLEINESVYTKEKLDATTIDILTTAYGCIQFALESELKERDIVMELETTRERIMRELLLGLRKE